MVDQLAVDVQHERGPGSSPRGPPRARTARRDRPPPAADALEPRGVRGVELGQGGACRAGVLEGLVVGLRAVEVVVRACPEDAHDDVRQAPRDRRDGAGTGSG